MDGLITIALAKGRGASLVIAASDASLKSRQNADLVCDGTDDPDIVLEAVHALGEIDGGKVLLSEGTFHGRFAVDRDNITLEGQGMYATRLRLPDGIDAPAQTLTIASDHVTVCNLEVDGNRGNQTPDTGEFAYGRADAIAAYGDHITIQNCYVHDPLAHGIIFWNQATDHINTHGAANASRSARDYVAWNRVIGCRVANTGSEAYGGHAIDSAFTTRYWQVIGNQVEGDGVYTPGIGWHGGHWDIIAYNTVLNCTTGILVTGDGDCEGVTIVGNMVKGCGRNTDTRGAICVEGTGTAVTITGNVVVDAVGAGISARTDSRDVTIQGNVILSPGLEGILANRAFFVTIANNHIVDSGTDGIGVRNRATDIVVDGNTILDAGESGIYVHPDSQSNAARVILSKNKVVDAADRGIWMRGQSSFRLADVSVDGNRVVQSTVGQNDKRGIVVVLCDRVRLRDNTIRNVGVGFDVQLSMEVDICGNIFADINSTTLNSRAIATAENNDLIIAENVMRRLKTTGISVGNFTAARTTIRDNEIDGGGTATTGILVGATPTDVVVEGNRIRGCTNPVTLDAPANVRAMRNFGYVTEASGTATIADTETDEVVTHGMATTPTSVTVTPRGNEFVWVSARDATTFTVTRSGSSGALGFDWSAELR